MAANVTVTNQKVGPGIATTTVISGATSVVFDCVQEVLSVFTGGSAKEFDIAAATTITMTVSGVTYTVAVTT